MTKPITPEEIGSAKLKAIPEIVFEVFNDEIARNFLDGFSKVYQEDVVSKLELRKLDRKEIFSNGWLNVEEAYRAVGWKVSYYKPTYYESGNAYFEFSKG